MQAPGGFWTLRDSLQNVLDTPSRAVPGIFLPCEIAGQARNDEGRGLNDEGQARNDEGRGPQ